MPFLAPVGCLKNARSNSPRALVAPPLRVVRHGLRLPQLPTIELAYSFGRRSNSRLVGELAHYLADSLVNAGTTLAPRMVS